MIYWSLALSTFSLGVLLAWFFSEPLLWYSLQFLSESVSRIIGDLTRQKVLYSASASGLFVTIFLILVGIFTTVFSGQRTGKWLRFSVFAAGVTTASLIFVAALQPAYTWLQSLISIPRFQIMDLPVLLFGLDLAPLAIFLRQTEFAPVTLRIFPIRTRQVIAVAIFSTGMLRMVFRQQSAIGYQPSAISHELSYNHSRKMVLIYGIGVYNWEKPQFGNYGIQSAGMFGMFPSYLKAMGYGVGVDSFLNKENLQDADVVMIINLDKNMPDSEKANLQRYINNGGSLLVIGDHTGLAGIMEPLNDLLKFVNIRYRFDCGHWLVDDWRDAFEFPAGPLFRGISDESDIAISIGASLDFSPVNATPVLFAKYGFSDWGNPLNSRNAYLGNRSYDPGEKLGDIVLAATTNYGKGKVLVFGDTSPFQNDALTYSFQFVKNDFDWLTAGDALAGDPVRWIADLLMLAGVILLFTAGKALREPISLVGTIIVIVFLWVVVPLTTSKNRALTSDFCHSAYVGPASADRLTSDVPLAYVDASHLNTFTQYEDNAIWPLTHNLIRNRYLPFVCRRFSPQLLEQSKVAFFVAPEKVLSNSEMSEINRYMKAGGVVIWSAGMETVDVSTSILNKMGLSLENVPLGPVSDSAASAEFTITPVRTSLKNYLTGAMVNEVDSSGVRPKFHSAWPIIISPGRQVDTLCTGWEYPVIVSEKVGHGEFVLVSDSGFFLSGNLETKTVKPYGYTVLGGNEMVFRGLVKKLMANGS